MHVPSHITYTGVKQQQQRPLSMGDMPGYAYQMNVPERILVAGGDVVQGDRAPPSEVMLDRMTVSYPTPVSFCEYSQLRVV
ncbi:unnamed protein product [Gongylonema pulchrum]|uniref:Miff domain-containing protein n=1 Tax=Gongylonema pulchrum TaxID=637853 RepID=A0A183DRC0_9BILA|nr:unnamed protein product [Gongylonema pulchrum]